jgi:hypothetical protein
MCGPKVLTASAHARRNPNVRYDPYPQRTSTYSNDGIILPAPATFSPSIVEQVTLGTTPAVRSLSQYAAAIEELNPDRATDVQYIYNQLPNYMHQFTPRPEWHSSVQSHIRADIELRPSESQFLQKPQSDSISIAHLEPQIARRSDPMEGFHGIESVEDMEEVVNSDDEDRPTNIRPRNPTIPGSEG